MFTVKLILGKISCRQGPRGLGTDVHTGREGPWCPTLLRTARVGSIQSLPADL